MEDFAHLIQSFPKLSFERNYSLSRHTTIGCGGEAALCAFPDCEEAALSLFRYLKREKIPHYILGAGANVLPSDEPFEGVIIKLSKMNRIVTDRNLLYALAGATGGALLRTAKREGIGGLEPFTGIPMSIGGGIAMNAGVSALHFSDVVLSVKAIVGGKIRYLSPLECNFSEKSSLFLDDVLILGAILKGYPSALNAILKREAAFREKRANLPKGRSMGCTFINPPSITAGRLIDLCGLKGLSFGSAKISSLHANFILSEGKRASDVKALIETVKKIVKEKTGISLKEEIREINDT